MPCYKCGWCCEIGPCHIRLYVNGKPMGPGPCDKLKHDGRPNGYSCGMVDDEPDAFKKHLAKALILAEGYCSNQWGPHPVRMLQMMDRDNAIKTMDDLENYYMNMVANIGHIMQKSQITKAHLQEVAEQLNQEVERIAKERFGAEVKHAATIEEFEQAVRQREAAGALMMSRQKPDGGYDA